MLHAFVTGGNNLHGRTDYFERCEVKRIDDAAAGSVCAILLVLASALLTGFNIYPSLVKWGGRGRWFHYRFCQFRSCPGD